MAVIWVQDGPRDLWDSEQNEDIDLLFNNYYEFQDSDSGSFRAQGPGQVQEPHTHKAHPVWALGP